MARQVTHSGDLLSDRWISDNLAVLRLPDDPQKAAELLQRIIFLCDLMLKQLNV